MPRRFLLATPWAQLQHLPRYLKGVVLRTPSLAERPADIPLLATRFLQRVAHRACLSPDALAWLMAREWPGNVRELKAVVESAGALLMPDQREVDAALLLLL